MKYKHTSHMVHGKRVIFMGDDWTVQKKKDFLGSPDDEAPVFTAAGFDKYDAIVIDTSSTMPLLFGYNWWGCKR